MPPYLLPTHTRAPMQRASFLSEPCVLARAPFIASRSTAMASFGFTERCTWRKKKGRLHFNERGGEAAQRIREEPISNAGERIRPTRNRPPIGNSDSPLGGRLLSIEARYLSPNRAIVEHRRCRRPHRAHNKMDTPTRRHPGYFAALLFMQKRRSVLAISGRTVGGAGQEME